MRLTATAVEYPLTLAPGQAVLHYPLAELSTDGSLRVIASETGDILIENTGRTRAAVKTGKKAAGRTLKPGEIVHLA